MDFDSFSLCEDTESLRRIRSRYFHHTASHIVQKLLEILKKEVNVSKKKFPTVDDQCVDVLGRMKILNIPKFIRYYHPNDRKGEMYRMLEICINLDMRVVAMQCFQSIHCVNPYPLQDIFYGFLEHLYVIGQKHIMCDVPGLRSYIEGYDRRIVVSLQEILKLEIGYLTPLPDEVKTYYTLPTQQNTQTHTHTHQHTYQQPQLTNTQIPLKTPRVQFRRNIQNTSNAHHNPTPYSSRVPRSIMRTATTPLNAMTNQAPIISLAAAPNTEHQREVFMNGGNAEPSSTIPSSLQFLMNDNETGRVTGPSQSTAFTEFNI